MVRAIESALILGEDLCRNIHDLYQSVLIQLFTMNTVSCKANWQTLYWQTIAIVLTELALF